YSDTNIYHDNTGSWYFSPEDANRFVHIGSGGLDVHRGLVRVEREDGYASIIGGKMNFDFALVPHNPPFREVDIETYYYWYRTKRYNWGACDFYTYKHTGRYLNVEFVVAADTGATGWVRIMD